MSSGLNYDRARRRRDGHRDPELYPQARWSLRGWRTEYPQTFPVTVTRIEPKESTMNPRDYNGHTPDVAQLVADNPDAADEVEKRLREVIAQLEKMTADGQAMLAKLREVYAKAPARAA